MIRLLNSKENVKNLFARPFKPFTIFSKLNQMMRKTNYLKIQLVEMSIHSVFYDLHGVMHYQLMKPKEI